MTTGQLTKLIDSVTPTPDKPRLYIGASSIGSDCLRQVWYGYKGYESEPNLIRQQRNMDIGKRFESMVLDWLESSGIEIIRPHKSNYFLEYFDNEQPYFRGHADGLLPGLNAVIDIKVIKASSYREFVKKGLKSWSQLYYSQLQSYMGMGQIPYAYLLALNKDTGELHDERITFDTEYYEALKARAMLIDHAESEPPRVSGNPAWWLCRGCRFRGVCHK